MRVLIAGFYNHHNLGDDAFRVALPKIIGTKHQYSFLHVNNLPPAQEINDRFDVLLLGAGDVVLPYFLDRVNQKDIEIPKILFGAGITYPSCISLGHLDQFDSIFLRNKTDLRSAEKRLGIDRVHYIPDLVFALDSVEPVKIASTRPRAGFYLIQAIDEQFPDNKERQKRVIRQVAECIEFVAQTHDVFLVRFDTSGKRDSDDVGVCRKMLNLLPHLVEKKVLHFDECQALTTPEQMMTFMSGCQINVCMRFHAHVFSIIQNIPFVSLSLTRKVRLLMEETGLAKECGVVIKEDLKTLRAVNLPVEEFKEKFNHVWANRHSFVDRLKNIQCQRQALLLSGIYERQISNCKKSKLTLPGDKKKQSFDSICETLCNGWEELLKFSLLTTPVPTDENDCSVFKVSPVRSKRRIENGVTTVCKNALYAITTQTDCAYTWGFIDNMKKNPFKFKEYLSWMMQNFAECEEQKSSQQKFNFNFIKQIEGTKLHRSGWPFVVSNMQILAAETGVLCDLYLDRTFHWGLQMLSCAGVIPYTQSWVGFIHHTPLPDYSNYNTVRMLQNPLFVASLQTCRGLFVLSQYMKEWLDAELPKLCLERPVPVCALTHPTEIPGCDACFSLPAFISNKNRMLVEIGAWLRDKFAIYDLGLLDNADRALTIASGKYKVDQNWGPSIGHVIIRSKRRRLRRCVLRGRDMSLYMPPRNICINECEKICEPESSVSEETSSSCSSSTMCRIDSEASPCRTKCNCKTMCRIGCTNLVGYSTESITTNKWIEGLRSHVSDTVLPSVDVLETLDNDAYDRLLTENIVFLCLRKPSACNTVIEAIVRKTPLLVNREPAVVEMLGENYPFYYNSLAEALIKSRDLNLIRQAHEYLCDMDQSRFDIGNFLQSIKDSEIYKNL